MKRPIISIIAAIGKNRELGKDNKLLWRIPDDMKRFKMLTMGHPVIMGRTTYESIGKPLLGRINIVLTRDESFNVPGCIVAYSLEEALTIARETDKEEIFIIGGGKVYEQALPLADKLYLTIVDGTYDADTYFPKYSRFTNVVSEKKGEYNNYKYTFLELIKNKSQ